MTRSGASVRCPRPGRPHGRVRRLSQLEPKRARHSGPSWLRDDLGACRDPSLQPTPVDDLHDAAGPRSEVAARRRGGACARPRAATRSDTRPRSSVSVTLPRLLTPSSRIRAPRTRRTRRPRRASRRTTRPGARTTTTTPILIRTTTPARRRGRVVSSTRASWSPGSARAGTRDETVSRPARPGCEREPGRPDGEPRHCGANATPWKRLSVARGDRARTRPVRRRRPPGSGRGW